MGKLYDVKIKSGEYTDREGNTKGRWVDVGVVMEGDGGPYMLLNPGINLAAYIKDGRSTVIASMFAPREDKQQGHQQAPTQQHAPAQAAAPAQNGGYQDFDDSSIPF